MYNAYHLENDEHNDQSESSIFALDDRMTETKSNMESACIDLAYDYNTTIIRSYLLARMIYIIIMIIVELLIVSVY